MQLFYDFFPIILFFIAYKIKGIYVATGIAILVTIIQVGITWVRKHKLEKMQLVTLALIILFGSATLLLHKPIFIKWKPTIVYWVFALFFFISQFVGEKPLICRMMGDKINLPRNIWNRLNISWVLFFTVMGFVNIYVIYNFSTNAWVNFKLFGTLGVTLLFAVIQAVYLSRYVSEKKM